MMQQIRDGALFEIRLLGSFRVVINGLPIEESRWTRQKPKLLLKLLALEPQHQLHREQLLEMLWPDQDTEAALRNLHRALHIARRALEPDLTAGATSQFLATRGQQVLLQAPGQLRIDLEEFEQRAAEALSVRDLAACESALALYTGDLLIEDLYEDWAVPRREQLRTLHHSLLAATAQLYAQAARWPEAGEKFRALLTSDPADEEAHRQLMRLYAQSGNRHQALQQYRQCVELLRREIDVEPEPATVELYEQIVSGRLRPSADSSLASAPLPPRTDSGSPATRNGEPPAAVLLPVSPFALSSDAASEVETTEAVALSEPEQRAVGRAVRSVLPRRLALAGALLALVAALVLATLSFARRAATIDSLAVLPLVNGSGDPNVEYLSEGITESIINSLSPLPGLRVMARNTVFRYKGNEADAQRVGRDLGVKAVLTGRVVQQGDYLIITTELVKVADGSQLWGAQYNRRLSDLMATQTEISWEISDKLKLRLSGDAQQRLTRRQTEDTRAYQLYLRGRYYWNRRTTEGVRQAVEYYAQAIAEDPRYALAYAGLADAYAVWPDDSLTREETTKKVKAAAVRAIELDDQLAEAHTSLAFARLSWDRDLAGAESSFRRSLELNPNYPTAHHWYGYALLARGKISQALDEIRRAQALDPVSPIISADVGELLFFARHYDQAIAQCRETLRNDPTFIPAHQTLGLAYAHQGLFQEAIAELRQAVALSGSNTYLLALLGYVYAFAGEREQARATLTQLSRLSTDRYVSPFHLALIHLRLGDFNRAFALLGQAEQDRIFSMLLIKSDPRLDPLRADPRFPALAERLGLQ